MLRASQSPVPAINLHLISILLQIKDNATSLDTLEHTLAHFFAILHQALFDNDFAAHSCDVESVLMVFIRGFDVHTVSCVLDSERCLLEHLSRYEKFPSWDLTFSVMKITGGMRKLRPGKQKLIEFVMQNLLIHPIEELELT